MATQYDPVAVSEIVNEFDARPELLVQILHAIVVRFSCISDEIIRQIANEVNLSRAEVHGVVSYYHDFRIEPPGRHVVKICQAESCQAMGSRELTAYAEKKFGTPINSTSADQSVTLEPIYCLGNCACSPAVMIDDNVYGRVDKDRFDALMDDCGGKAQ